MGSFHRRGGSGLMCGVSGVHTAFQRKKENQSPNMGICRTEVKL